MMPGIARSASSMNPYVTQTGVSPKRLQPQAGLPFVDPNAIRLQCSRGVSMAEVSWYKPQLVQRLLALHHQARRQAHEGVDFPEKRNPSGFYVVSELWMQDGRSYRGVNVESSLRKTHCAEENALGQAVSQARLAGLPGKPRVKWVLTANQTFGDPIKPCCECLERTASNEGYADPGTVFFSLRQRPDGELVLFAQAQQDILPMASVRGPSLSVCHTEQLPLWASPQATQVMCRLQIRPDALQGLMAKTQQAFLQQNPGGVAMTCGTLVDGQTYLAHQHTWWSPRFTESPDTAAVATGIHDRLQKQALLAYSGSNPHPRPRVEALAYYGSDPDHPRPGSLGRLMYPRWGNPDLLVVRVFQGRLMVHMAQEYFQPQ